MTAPPKTAFGIDPAQWRETARAKALRNRKKRQQ